MTKIKFLETEFQNNKFLVENIDPIILNTLRRMISYLLPIYAVEEIDFHINDSVVIDEMLANRIGLCPIKTPLINTGKKVTLSLDKQGPCTVYSKDFISNDPDIVMAYDNIPITKLNEGEKINLDCFAVIGSGKDHVKYSSSIVSYSQLFEVDSSRTCEDCKNILDLVSKNALNNSKPYLIDSNMQDLVVLQIEKCDKNCLKINSTNNYILNLELIGQIDIKDLIKLSKRYVKEYFSVLKKKIK
ncbi:MAG: DNA-directed RNA polymerase subunit D [Candidatus ainarchaeum sp.]|nr:DNA-directed RNA polymerase subunit D [Candidatus ainarchaeum sp.]MDD3975776.1 DNA-directed RNA polymerase subunit D [Candidatus ainarchaeum sp.]